MRFVEAPPSRGGAPLLARAFDEVVARRQAEADEFYAAITPPHVSDDAAMVIRQALAGMLWSQPYSEYDLNRWLCASHRTGWTGAVARLIQAFGYLEGDQVLNGTPVRAWYVPTGEEELQAEAGT